MTHSPLLINALRNPQSANSYSLMEWDLLVRQARAAGLLAHMGYFLDAHLPRHAIPDRVKEHFHSAQLIVKRQMVAVRWEISLIRQALFPHAIPVIVLKGAAYILANLPNSRGRLFQDIDILVPRAALNLVETTLKDWGWRSSHNNKYDQRYYRQWMHELPPLRHQQRKTELDIHHSILPLTTRCHLDPEKLIKSAVADPEQEEIYWLESKDLVLHSATHLFYEGEFVNGLRDLVDIDSLLKHFGREQMFWRQLCARAHELGLTRPLYYALRYGEMVLGTPIPPEIQQEVSPWGPSYLLKKLMDALFVRALRPLHNSCSSFTTTLARRMLYIRAHYLRMPLRMLIPHLIHKSLVGEQEDEMPKEVRRFIQNHR